MQTCTGKTGIVFSICGKMTEEFCTGGGQDGKLGRGGAAGAVRRQRGCGGAADHGRRAEAGRAVSRRADVRRRYRGAGPASAHADGAARQHAGGARPGGAGTGLLRRGRAGHDAGGRRGQAAARLLRRRLSRHGRGALLRDEDRYPPWPVRAGIGKHGQGREGRLYRDHAHQHEPPAPPSALGAAALRAEDRGPSEPDGRHGLLPCGSDGSGARPAHGAAAGGDRHRRDADARERGGICDRLA